MFMRTITVGLLVFIFASLASAADDIQPVITEILFNVPTGSEIGRAHV